MENNLIGNKPVVRNVGIDWLKALAVFLVMNSHMQICYPKYGFLATGGAIGDALFFFASGFTLFLGRQMRFDNWYKRRINRIYPSIIATAIIAWAVWGNSDSIGDILLGKGYWFIGCILVYYILLYPVKTIKNGYFAPYVLAVVGACVFLYFLFFHKGQLYYGGTPFGRVVFFLFMLQGAIMGKCADNFTFKWWYVLLLAVSICMFYAIQAIGSDNWIMLLSFVALMGITRYAYLSCCAPILAKIYNHRWLGGLVYIISQCCLEVYLIQKYIFTDQLNSLFPLNIPIIMIAVLLAAYIIKTIAEFLSQTFKSEPYEWRKMLLVRR